MATRRDVCEEDWLSAEEEAKCIERLQSHSATKDEENRMFTQLLKKYEKFIIRELSSQFNTLFIKYKDEMMNAVAMQIWQDLPCYDRSKGAMTTFLKTRIDHAAGVLLNEELSQTSAHYGTGINKIKRAIAQLESEGRKCDVLSLSEKTGLPIHTVTECLLRMDAHSTVHYDSDEYGKENLYEPDKKLMDPEAEYIARAEQDGVRRMIDKLDPESRKVVLMHFGFLTGGKIVPVAQIATKLGTDKNRVNSILAQAQRTLGNAMREEGLFQHPRIRTEASRVCKAVPIMPKVTEWELGEAMDLMDDDTLSF